MGNATAQIGQRLLFGLKGAVGGNGRVVVGQEGVHGGDVALENGITPYLFQLEYLVVALMLLRSGHLSRLRGGAEGQRKRDKD